jgi:PAS domain S-box-containing protein
MLLAEMRPQLRPYAITFLAYAIALLLTWFLQPLMTPTVFALFYPAVMVSSLYGGLKPGLLSIALAALTTKYFFLAPVYSLAFSNANTIFRFTVLVLVSLMISLLSTALRTAKQRTEASLLKLQTSEEKYRRIVETANEGIWVIDAETQTTYVNTQMAQMLGYTVAEMLGRSSFDFIHEVDRAAAQQRLELRRQGMGEPLEFCLRRKDGSSVWIQSSTSSILLDNGERLGQLAMVTDITDRKRAEQRQSIQYAVTRVLAEATTLADAVPMILQSLCESLGWQLGIIWSLDRQANVLRCVNTWHLPALNVEDFTQVNQSTTFSPGAGLPGRIWASGQPIWIANLIEDANFPRAAFAARGGLHTVLGFPIRLGNEILGVIECFSDKIQEPDDDLLHLMASIGSQIGQFMERKRTEEELREQEERLRVALKNSPISVFNQDRELRYTWKYSPAFETTVDAVLGKQDIDLLPSDDAEVLTRIKRQVLDTEVGMRQEVKIKNEQGQDCYYDLTVEPLRDAKNEVIGVTCAAIDISEPKQAELALQTSETLLNALLASAPIGLAFFDRDLRYIHANQALANINGLPLSEHLGRTLWDVLPEWASQLAPILQQVMETKQPLLNQELSGETNPPGVHRHTLVNYYPVCLPDGQVLGVGVTSTDVTELKRIEQALRESEERYRCLVTASSQIVWKANAEGQLVEIQGWEEFTGQPVEELLIQGSREAIHPEDLKWAGQAWWAAIATKSTFDVEHRIRKYDGTYEYFNVRGVPVFDAEGRVRIWVGMTTNINARKQAEEALRLSRERLDLVLQAAKLGLWYCDLPFSKLNWNDKCKEHFGLLPNEDVTIDLFYDRLHPDDRERTRAAIEQSVSQHRSYDIDYRTVAFDGRVRWIRAIGRGFYDSEGNPTRFDGITIDITQRKQAEQVQQYLAEASQVLSSSLDYQTILANLAQLAVPQLADWCTVQLVEDDGSVQSLATAHVNPDKVAWAKLINQKYPFNPDAPRGSAHVLRTRQSEFYPDIPDHLLVETAHDAEHLQILREVGFKSVMIVPLLTRGQVLGTIAFVAAESGRCYTQADLALAEELGCRAALAVENARLYRQSQQARHIAEQAAERTARLQKVTAALSEALTPQQVAEVVVNQGIEAMDARAGLVGLLVEQGTFIEFVGALGYPQEAIEAWKRFPITAKVPLAEAVRTGEPIFLDSVEALTSHYPALADVTTVTGNRAVVAIPLIAEGQTLGGMGISFAESQRFSEEDKSFMLTLAQQCAQAIARARLYEAEQRARASSEAARAEAEAANRIKDEFLAVLSHELRSPLNPILGWTKLLRSRKFDETATDRALETIERNAKLQTQLIEDLLDVSRILRGKMVLNVSPVNLATTIEAALETVRLAADSKGIQIHTWLDSNGGKVCGDANRLQQVVWNLLSNAVKFTPPGGRVEVRLSVVHGLNVDGYEDKLDPFTQYAQIQVQDNGKGISPNFIPYIFEYFRQENSTTTRKFGGLGLGLAIVRHLVELHGGFVFADSPGEGSGATFTVRLPLMAAHSQVKLEETQPNNAADLRGLQVLIVDDEDDIRELVAFILEQYGADVTVAASASQAVVALSQSVPDILLSDIGMPEVDGYMLMRQVRTLSPEEGGEVPAIALTAYAGEYNQQQALAAGFQLHIPKPVEPEELVKAIARLVGRTA